MKALHVIPSLSVIEGGPSATLPLLVRSLVEQGLKVDVATTQHRDEAKLGMPVERNGSNHFYFPRQTELYKYSRPFSKWFRDAVGEYDLVHIHALFSYTSVVAARIARSQEVPYIIRPLGVLNQWGMRNRRRFLKAISFRVLEWPILRNAAAIHYTSEFEKREAELVSAKLREIRSPVIPLPIEVAAGDRGRFLARFPAARGRQIILFLSRLHEKKRVELLLEAFGEVHLRNPNALLVIAGDGASDYVSVLREKAAALNISEAIIWTGFLEGEDKWAAFAAATVFVLPSFSENFGIAVAEALACSVPVVITEGVGLAEETTRANAGIVVQPTASALAQAIHEMLGNPERRYLLATNGRHLADTQFSLSTIGRALAQLYQDVLAR